MYLKEEGRRNTLRKSVWDKNKGEEEFNNDTW